MSEIVFPFGVFYTCTDGESLTFDDPWEAIEDYLGGWIDHKMGVTELLAEIRKPITVTAFNRMGVPESQIKAWAESLTEHLSEMWGDEYGDPNGDEGLTDHADSLMLAAVTAIIKDTNVWACQEGGHIDLTPDQVEALAREHRPDWFEEGTP